MGQASGRLEGPPLGQRPATAVAVQSLGRSMQAGEREQCVGAPSCPQEPTSGTSCRRGGGSLSRSQSRCACGLQRGRAANFSAPCRALAARRRAFRGGRAWQQEARPLLLLARRQDGGGAARISSLHPYRSLPSLPPSLRPHLNTRRHSSMEMCHSRTVLSMEADKRNCKC